MLRAIALAALIVSAPSLFVQSVGVLHIKVMLVDADGKAAPVPRHALLISDNPASAPPRRIVTGLDGTADVKLAPGNYTVESDRPVTFQGKTYQWTQIVDVAAGRDTVLELSAANAEVAASAAGAASSTSASDPSFLLNQWQESVVGLWTPTMHASGFVIDTRGLIATNQRVVGTATSVEVQLAPAAKVAASVLAADPDRDVAILWIDPKAAASIRPVPLGCAAAAKPTVAAGQEIFTIGTPFREPKGMSSATVRRVDPHAIVSDFMLAFGSAGGPVFTRDGAVIGITSIVGDQNNLKDERSADEIRVVSIGNACEVVAAAETKMKDTAPPSRAHLPMEPVRPFPVDVVKEVVKRRAGSLNPYQMPSAEFDIAFITPVLIYGAQYQMDQARSRERGKIGSAPISDPAFVRPLMDFSNWSEYVEDVPPVLLIRVTPKLVEGFWTTVARGAARTQGVSLPPIKHFKSGFLRMRAFCGDTEVIPIHPFKLEQRTSDTEAIYEGLYVFDPGALKPDCGTIKLVLYSEKEPAKADTRIVDARIVQQIWDDFAPYRAAK